METGFQANKECDSSIRTLEFTALSGEDYTIAINRDSKNHEQELDNVFDITALCKTVCAHLHRFCAENVSEYEAVGQINGGTETGYYRGSATEFSVRFSDISANYRDTICVRVRAVRNSNTGGATTQTTSDWSSQSCITVPEAPLRPPQMIELSLIE